MINYTERVRVLMGDIIQRVPALSFIDLREVLVFARWGKTDTDGAFATCHSLTLPDSEPSYYFWRDRRTGRLTRRSEWFVARSPQVRVGHARIDYLVSITLPRFCNQTLRGSQKGDLYPGGEDWLAKLDTIVHELFHVDPHRSGIRPSLRSDGRPASVTHTPQFFADVARMVHEYVASRPDPKVYDFLRQDFDTLARRLGGVVATTFRTYPSFPQRYRERLAEQPRTPKVPHIVPLSEPFRAHQYTEADLEIRRFMPSGVRRLRDEAHGVARARRWGDSSRVVRETA
jgi:hypothetical protein